MSPLKTLRRIQKQKLAIRTPNTKKVFQQIVECNDIRRHETSAYREIIRALYDGPAGAVLAFGSWLSMHEPLVGRLFRTRKFNLERFSQILDAGCGAGQIMGHVVSFADSDAMVVGCDLSHPMLVRAGKRVKTDRPHFLSADMQRLPFADGSFDCVTCGWAIEYFLDPVPTLTELQRVLKPGGSLFLMATEDTFFGAFTSRTWKCRTFNRQEMRKACEVSGLPWKNELWFTPIHRLLGLGGIVVEACKPEDSGTATAANEAELSHHSQSSLEAVSS